MELKNWIRIVASVTIIIAIINISLTIVSGQYSNLIDIFFLVIKFILVIGGFGLIFFKDWSRQTVISVSVIYLIIVIITAFIGSIRNISDIFNSLDIGVWNLFFIIFFSNHKVIKEFA